MKTKHMIRNRNGHHPAMYLFYGNTTNDEMQKDKIYTILLCMLQNKKIQTSDILYRDVMGVPMTLLHMVCKFNVPNAISLLLTYGAKLECGLQKVIPMYNMHADVWKEVLEYGMDPTTKDDYAIMISGRNMTMRYVQFLECNGFPRDVYVPRMALHAWVNNCHKIAIYLICAAQQVPTLSSQCRRVILQNGITYHNIIPDLMMIPKKDIIIKN